MPDTKYFPLMGGLDLTTPAISTDPGHVIAAANYEPAERGYRRIDGFERFDGRPKPSDASYWVLNFDTGTAAISEGDTVTGLASSATGKALVDAVVSSGTYGAGDAAGYLVLTNVSGTFQNNEQLQVAAATKSLADGTATERGASNDTDDATWLQDAIETARALIGTVTGSGNTLGGFYYKGVNYAIRNNAGGTAAALFKSSTSGWTAVDLGRQIDFTAGTVAFTEGQTLTGGASGATATVKRVIVQSGDWSTSDAAGYIILASVVLAFQNPEAITDGAGGSATTASLDTAITLPAGGRYDIRKHNFFGASNLYRVYGANGVGKAFEFDGTVWVPIRTGMTVDTPDHVAVFKNHLFLSFPGGSLQNSGTGAPYDWTVISGASEIGIGQDVTGLVDNHLNSLVVIARNKVAVLYGNDTSDFVLETLADDAGGVEWTVQMIGAPLYMDDRGFRSLATTQAFGNFKLGTVTRMVEPIFVTKRKAAVTATASIRVRAKDQYRLFFSDGTGLTVYFGRKQAEVMPFDLGKTVYAAWSDEDISGNEIMFFGSSDGYVYQLDSGLSLDGTAVPAYFRLPFNHVGAPTQDKRWHKAVLEIDASSSSVIGVVPEYSYAASNNPATTQQDFTVTGGGGFWNEADWNDFYWESPVEGLAETFLDGIGNNISLTIVSEQAYEEPHTIHGLTLHFSPRRLIR